MVRVVASLVFLLSVVAYAAPSVIAIWRAHKRWPLVVAIDVLLGWTIVGWLAALVMALELRLPKASKRPKPQSKHAATAPPPVTSDPPASAAPVREHVEPPPVQEEVYARWLDDGAAMNV